MNKKIPCEVIRDLFPSYIDRLTSPVTEEVIKDHLKECEDCRKALAAMGAPSEAEETAETDKKEIDFLKKNKKKNFRVLMTSLGGALALLLVCFPGGHLYNRPGELRSLGSHASGGGRKDPFLRRRAL